MSGETAIVRLFVSSTFQDMHAERDRLNRFVFPELRSRCQRRGADFVGVDLRWGAPVEDVENVGAVDLCLAEIDRCRPFFLALLGDRYGWIPPPNHIRCELSPPHTGAATINTRAAIMTRLMCQTIRESLGDVQIPVVDYNPGRPMRHR